MTIALGVYLRTLREGRGLRNVDVRRLLAERMGAVVEENRLWRVEHGKSWPQGDFLTALLDILHARLADVAWIQQHPQATEEDGQRLAVQVLTSRERDSILALADTDAKKAALLRRIATMTNDPALQARIEGYLDALEGLSSR